MFNLVNFKLELLIFDLLQCWFWVWFWAISIFPSPVFGFAIFLSLTLQWVMGMKIYAEVALPRFNFEYSVVMALSLLYYGSISPDIFIPCCWKFGMNFNGDFAISDGLLKLNSGLLLLSLSSPSPCFLFRTFFFLRFLICTF